MKTYDQNAHLAAACSTALCDYGNEDVRPERALGGAGVVKAYSRKRAVECFGWAFFFISPAQLHLRPMERTCGWAGEIKLTPPMGV